jgi:hypothetical protein
VTPEPGTTIAPAEPTPAATAQWRPKRPRLMIGVAAAAVVMVAGLAALAFANRPGETTTRPLGPVKADAARECRTAIGVEAKRRVDAGARPGSGVVSTVSDITVTDPQWGVTRHAWTVDGTVKFSIASMFGVVPTVVDMRCTASRSSGGQLVTSVSNR